MGKFIIYSKTDGQVWSIVEQYTIEEDGTIAGGYNGYNTLRYHVSTNPAVVEISDEEFKQLNISNLDKYVVVDNTIIERPDDENYVAGESILEDKIVRLNIDCTKTINNGTDVTLADGTVEHFTLDAKDQANLLGVAIELLTGAEQIMWHIDNQSEHCRFFSADDGWTIIKTLSLFKTYHITYFRDLRIYVRSLTNEDEIKNITYGYILPNEFKSDVLKNLETSMRI